MMYPVKKFRKLCLVVIIIIFESAYVCYCQPIVTLEQTKIIGTQMTTRHGRTVSGFLGIPYAESPVGRLRFRNPVLKKIYKETLLATKEGNMCPQVTEDSERKALGDEDCLFLNVFTPWTTFKKKNPLLPVMVLFHGSGHLHGSSNIEKCGPGFLLDKNIVYVSLNYRLGILGFLTTGDEEALGNFGLKDQVVALQWVQKYIQYFGGNPKKITLFGYSTGADDINFHLFSNITEGLFHQYIMQSGCALTPRSFRERKENSQYAKAAAEQLGCPSQNSRLLVNCLRNIDTKKIVKTVSIFKRIQWFLKALWLPTNEVKVEGAYITEDPYDLLDQKKMRDLPWINGLVKDEGLLWTAKMYVNSTLYDEIIGNLDVFLADIISTYTKPKNSSALVSEIKQFYFKNKVSSDKNLVLEQLRDFLGDLLKIYPGVLITNRHSKNSKQPLYFYRFDYRGLLSFSNTATHENLNIGVDHTDETYYLFPHKSNVPVKFNATLIKSDSVMTDIIVDLWTSFAINGVPKSDKLSEGPDMWKPYQPGTNIMEIGDDSNTTTKILHSIFEERMNFWKRHFPRLY